MKSFILSALSAAVLMALWGCGSGGGSLADTATISGSLLQGASASLSRAVSAGSFSVEAVDSAGTTQDTAQNVADVFTLHVPVDRDYVLVIGDADGSISAMTYQSGTGERAEFHIGSDVSTIDLGHITVDVAARSASRDDVDDVSNSLSEPVDLHPEDNDGDHIPDAYDRDDDNDGIPDDADHSNPGDDMSMDHDNDGLTDDNDPDDDGDDIDDMDDEHPMDVDNDGSDDDRSTGGTTGGTTGPVRPTALDTTCLDCHVDRSASVSCADSRWTAHNGSRVSASLYDDVSVWATGGQCL